MVVALAFVAAAVGTWLLPHWLGEYQPDVVYFARIFLLAVPFWAVQITGQAALEALELFSLSNIVQTMIPVVTLLGLLTCYAMDKMTPVVAAACYAGAIFPTAVTILIFLWRHREGRARVTVAAWRTLIGYGLRSAPLDLLDTLSLYIDQVLVIGLLTAEAMGSYAVVLSLSRALLVFQSAVVMVLFPKAAGKSTSDILQMVGRCARVSVLITGAAAIAAGLLGPVMIRIFYGQSYLAAVPALRVLVTEVVVQGMVVLLSRGLMAAGRPGIVSILQATGLAVAVPLMFVFIPKYGVAGAAMALLCSTLTRLALLTVAVPMVLKTGLPRLLPGLADVRFVVGIALQSRQKSVG
jgi:O-antigen/teichoic acid export membrane protein